MGFPAGFVGRRVGDDDAVDPRPSRRGAPGHRVHPARAGCVTCLSRKLSICVLNSDGKGEESGDERSGEE